jgi:hypothetical protein
MNLNDILRIEQYYEYNQNLVLMAQVKSNK